jgi:hypothetical protein
MGTYHHKTGKSKDQSHYYPPELMPMCICAACLGIVLKESPEAKELYHEIVECCKLPGLQQIFDKLDDEIPEGTELIKKIVDKSGLDFDKPPDMKNVGIPESRDVLRGSFDLISDYTKELTPWILEGKTRNNDLNLLLLKIKEMIRVGFNNKKDQAKGIYKVSGKQSYYLGLTIWISALFENCKLMLKEWERLKLLKIGDKVYSMNDIMTDRVTNRIHRNLTKQYKSSGFLQVRDPTLEKMAYDWYQCRVVCSGPEEYSRKLQLKGEPGDSANLINEIEACDLLIGYPRRNHRKE